MMPQPVITRFVANEIIIRNVQNKNRMHIDFGLFFTILICKKWFYYKIRF